MRIRHLPFIFISGCLAVFIFSCQRRTETLKPGDLESVHALTVENGKLKALFVDNTELPPGHKAGYNGIAQLYFAGRDSGIFVPAFAGFNLEHLFGGDSLEELFEPRLHPMTLFRKSVSEILLYQEPTPLSGVESLTSFKLEPPFYIEITFRCIFHKPEFFRHDYAGLFWASYIDNPPDKKIYFKGVRENSPGDSVSWIAAWSEQHGINSTHKSVSDDHEFYFAENFNASLASHFSEFRFTEPFFFGRFKNMALAYFFDGAGIIRFSQSPTGGGDLNPAWDFQYLIPSPRQGKEYSFKARLVYKPFISAEDLFEEYYKWRGKK